MSEIATAAVDLVKGLATGGVATSAAAPPVSDDAPMTAEERLELSILAGLIAVQPTPQAAGMFVRQWKGNRRMMLSNPDWLRQLRHPEL